MQNAPKSVLRIIDAITSLPKFASIMGSPASGAHNPIMVNGEAEVVESGDTCYLSGDIENPKNVESCTLRMPMTGRLAINKADAYKDASKDARSRLQGRRSKGSPTNQCTHSTIFMAGMLIIRRVSAVRFLTLGGASRESSKSSVTTKTDASCMLRTEVLVRILVCVGNCCKVILELSTTTSRQRFATVSPRHSPT
jgi:hypothetical protein